MIDRSLGVAACCEQGSRIGGQDREPIAEIGGVVVARRLLKPELCAPERSTEFCDEFLCSVSTVSEPAREVAIET